MYTDTTDQSQDHSPSEAEVAINGHTLTTAESMSLRVAASSLISELTDNPDALGTDDHGRTMVEGYLKNLRSVEETIRQGKTRP